MTEGVPAALRRRLFLLVGVLAVVAALGSLLWLNGDDGGAEVLRNDNGVALRPTDPGRPRATPVRHTGPQGRVGQFVVGCTYSHSGPHDPIVHFGHEGRSHRHDFYGSVVTDSEKRVEELLDTETTCNKSADTAAYWQPALYDHDQIVVAIHHCEVDFRVSSWARIDLNGKLDAELLACRYSG